MIKPKLYSRPPKQIMNSKKEKALKTKYEESLKTMNQSQMEHPSYTQTEMTEYYRLTTSELIDGISHNKQWMQLTKQTWRNQKTMGKLRKKKKMPSIRRK